MSRRELPVDSTVVADGIRIAIAGVFIELKNRILVDALKVGADYDEAKLTAAARLALSKVAGETVEVAVRAERRELPPPSVSDGAAHHRHHAQLMMAPTVYRSIARELQATARDELKCLELIRQARDSAADELRHEVVRKLTTDYAQDERYERDRGKRMRRVGKDLRRLGRSAPRE